MHASTSPPLGGSASRRPGARPTRLTGAWIIMARAVWLTLVTFSLGLFLAGLPVFYVQIQQACTDATTCNLVGALNAQGLQDLPTFGFSVSGFAALMTIGFTIIAALWSGIGFLIFWRRSADPFALLAAFFLVVFNPTYPGFSASALALVHPAFSAPLGVVSFLGQLSLSLFFLLFPTGRVTPRWVSLIIPLVIIQAGGLVFPLTSPLNSYNWPQWVNGLLAITIYGSAIVAQVYRYRRHSTVVERQQTKWVVFGIVTVAAGFIVLAPLFNSVFSDLAQPDTPSASLLGFAYPVLLLSLPLSIGAAILRYRLYDIDLLINKSLVYGTLTGLLAGIYAGLILGLESLAQALTGTANQPVPLVISTLTIAALVLPARQRIQSVIDRRFYRRKYDAEKTLAAFSAALRQEVDLEQLRDQVLAVVQETMQPEHVSLWLRQPERYPTEQAHRLNQLDQASTKPSQD